MKKLAARILCVLATMTTTSLAEADNEDPALVHFKHGLELHEEQDFTGALVEFRRAYEISPTYKILFNVGQVCFQINDYACALRSFQKYLSEGGKLITSDRRAQVQRDIEKLEMRVGRLEILTNVPGVDISIDDVYLGKTPLKDRETIVSAGKRRIVATKEGRVSITRVLDVSGTDSQRVQLDLVAVVAKEPGGPPTRLPAELPQQTVDSSVLSKMTPLSWAGVGTSVALGAASIVTGVIALDASRDLERQRFAGYTPNDEIVSKQSDVQLLSGASDVLLGGAVITLATTLILTFATPSSSSSPRAGARVVPSGIAGVF